MREDLRDPASACRAAHPLLLMPRVVSSANALDRACQAIGTSRVKLSRRGLTKPTLANSMSKLAGTKALESCWGDQPGPIAHSAFRQSRKVRLCRFCRGLAIENDAAQHGDEFAPKERVILRYCE